MPSNCKTGDPRILGYFIDEPYIREEYLGVTDHNAVSNAVNIWFKYISFSSKYCLVFLAGNAVNHTEFEDMRALFERAKLSTLIFDMRGHGKSQKPVYPDAYSLVRLAMDLREVVTRVIHKNQKIIFIGQSVGALIGVTYQNMFTDRLFDALILLSMSHRYKSTFPDNPIYKEFICYHLKLHEEFVRQITTSEKIDKKLLRKLKFGKLEEKLTSDIVIAEIKGKISDYKNHTIADFRKVTFPEPAQSIIDYFNSLYSGNDILEKVLKKNPHLKTLHRITSNLSRRIRVLAQDLNVHLNVIEKEANQALDFKVARCLSSGVLFSYDVSRDLELINVPTLFINGKLDAFICFKKTGGDHRCPDFFCGTILDNAGNFIKGKYPTTFSYVGKRTNLKQKRIVIVPDASHTISFSHAKECASEITNFLYSNIKDVFLQKDLNSLMKIVN